MGLDFRAADDLTIIAWQAMRDAWSQYSQATLSDEEDITAAFVSQFVREANRLTLPGGYTLGARVLTHRRNGEEKATGADLGVKLDIDTDDLKACYGWIAQAK